MTQLPEDLLKELMATFSVEVSERVEAANRHMLSLEEATDSATVTELGVEIFREVHSIKGAAGAVGIKDVEMLAHRLETLFEPVRNGNILPASACDAVYRSIDAIEALVGAAVAETTVDVDVAGLAAELDACAVPSSDPSESTAAAPSNGSSKKGKKIGRSANGSTSMATGTMRSPPRPAMPTGPATRATSGRLDLVDEKSPPGVSEPSADTARPGEDSVRVPTAKLDALMAQVGELLVTTVGNEQSIGHVAALLDEFSEAESLWRDIRPRYQKLVSDISGDGPAPDSARGEIKAVLEFLRAADEREDAARRRLGDLRRSLGVGHRRMSQVVSELQEEVRRTRMLPVSSVFSLIPRQVRDLSKDLGKEIAVRIEGGETEVDRSVLEQIKSPLTHLVRNSIDHGIESPRARLDAGKPSRGTITLSASQRGDSIILEIADDGAGIDSARVRAAAIRKGLLSAEAAEGLEESEVLDLIFSSGLSTSPIITDLSGRGVGMDVVRESVGRINGIVDVENEPGRGTRFVMTLPLTVATTQCLTVECGGARFAMPVTNIFRIVRAGAGDTGKSVGRATINVDSRPVPLHSLEDVLGLEAGSSGPPSNRRPVIVMGSVEKRVAFAADALLGTQEVVVKPLPSPLEHVRNVAGASILGSGEVVLVLNVGDLVRSAERAAAGSSVRRPDRPAAVTVAPLILVADDSIVTRTLEKNILEGAGYRVTVAGDGQEAWEMLQAGDIDLLVTDVEMPRLGGFELTSRVREDEKLSDMPVILVTSLNSKEHQQRGIEVGADAHIVKQAFNQDTLLDTIRRLV